VDIENLSVERLRQLIEQVVESPQYRENARKFEAIIAQTRGLDLAADLIERAFKGTPKAVASALAAN